MSFDRMTVADVQEQVGNLQPNVFTFLQALNQVMSRYYDMGVFKDMARKVVFANGSSTGIITLGPRWLSLLGISVENGRPLPVYGQFHEWMELGNGYVEPDELTMVGVIDMGGGYVTTVDIETEGTLRWKIYSSQDAGKKVRIFGLGTVNGVENQEVYDSSGVKGIELTTVDATVDTAQTFSDLSPPYGGVKIPSNMVGASELYVVNSGVATLLARYEPGETRPSYRRYKTGVVDSTPILAFCKLRFNPYRDSTDFVDPCCIGAIVAGMQALQKERAMEFDEAFKQWEYGKRLWMVQLRQFMGSAKPRFPILGRELMVGPTTVS